MLERVNQALREGDMDRALELWCEVTAGRNDPATLLQHLQLLEAAQRTRESGPVLEALLAHSEATPAVLLPVAKQLFQLGRFENSARFTAASLACDPDNPDIAAMHAASLERSGKPEEARAICQRTLSTHPSHSRSMRLLAHIDRRAGEFERARDELVKHLAAHPSPDDWRLRYELAPVLDRLGEYGEAIRQLALAKHQLRRPSQEHHPRWRTMTERQWELTSALDPARLQAWSAPLEPSMRLCLMGGFPRSGTTLLEQVLTSHAGCLGTDETGILATRFRDPLVMAPSSIEAVLAELDGMEGDQLLAGRAEYLRCTEDRLGVGVEDRLLLEKEPLLTADLAVPLRLFPEAKILMPLRDPRDVVISFFFTIVPLAPNSVAAAHLGESCRYYAEVMRHWLHLRKLLAPGRWMEARYEDLIVTPEAETRRLAGFLGLEWSSMMLNHHQNPAGKEVSTPTYDDVSKPLYTRSLGRWKNYRQWLEPHLEPLEPMLEAFGYQ